MAFNLNSLVKGNILKLAPYSSARDEFSGDAKVFLDANENSFGSPLNRNYNRYPDPHQKQLKKKLATIKNVEADQIFLGNGSDECIDLLYRCFCKSGVDNVIICPPTYGMYEVSANINEVDLKRVDLDENFQLRLAEIENAIDSNTKLIWICSPNNPSGNLLNEADIKTLISKFSGIVVVDEAYIDFTDSVSFNQYLSQYPNLVVMQTFSKAWGLAGLRLGMAFASTEIIAIMDKVKPPYNINQVTQELALQALENENQMLEMQTEIVTLRQSLAETLLQLPMVDTVYPSDANFLLVKVKDPAGLYQFLIDKGLVVRDRHKVILCDGCLRITIGTLSENEELINLMHEASI